jgi:hypothetical protein
MKAGSSSVEPLPYDKLPATGGSRRASRLPIPFNNHELQIGDFNAFTGS